jgi:energy-coupling factor transporter ATP-binding protein EcfA2
MSGEAPQTTVPAQAPDSVPIVARIAKISLSDYRAFPSSQTYDFDLSETGKNLLLYGENGSGKTSLFRALRDLVALHPGPENFADLRHIFAPAEEGFVSIQLTAGTPNEFRWDYGNEHPRKTAGQPYASLAERCRFLDYRALLETNFAHRENVPNLFDLLVKEILKDLPVIVGGKLEQLRIVYDRMKASHPGRYQGKRHLEAVDRECADFNAALANHLPEVVKEGNRLTAKLGYEGLSFALKPTPVYYDSKKKTFTGEEITLSVQLFGKPIDRPQIFLNEARLTALALAIYLGAARLVLKSPSAGLDETSMVRLLVLDDVLIGLDLANRLPVLRVLNDEFSDWQVILMTYDRVWFELARIETAASERWVAREMHAKPMQVGSAVFDSPLLRPMEGTNAADHFLSLADQHLAANDERPAAFYARAAFEVKLKHYCHDKKVQVAYDLDGRNLTTDHFVDAIERRLNWSGKMSKILFALTRVKVFRHSVLNPLAHYYPVTLSPNEVKLAIDAVRALAFPSDKTDFAKETGRVLARATLTPEERIDAANWLRTTFEVELRVFLVQKQGRVLYRHDWTKMTLLELWDSAKVRLNALNAALASTLFTDIEAHRRVFLDEWKFSTVSILTKPDLDTAWAAFRDPASPPNAPKTRLATFHA